ncbi:MAG TPA: GTPase HflX [Methanomassiliicoccales archaeon]|nr:GTPase HflX [Methanomassiliicoccales archaeon]
MEVRGSLALKKGALISLDRDTAEIEELCRSADIDVLYVVMQRRTRPDKTYFLGRGRFNELKDLLVERPVDVVVINGELKPSQHFNLENGLKVECLDRIAVVLDIFTSRAEGRESKLQVELARLRYQVPLMREWVHSAKAGEHPGFLGGGEYQVDVYYNLIRRRIAQIDEELRSLARDGDLRRGMRRFRGFRTVCLAGYTNAGKSSLMRRLTGEEVLVADRMFSTLGTTTRRVGSSKILLTDTVGFLKDLPHFMVESFRNTLQDVFTADLVVLVIDSSEPLFNVSSKVLAVQEIFGDGALNGKLMVALNKMDQDPDRLTEMITTIHDVLDPLSVIGVSAVTGDGIGELLDAMQSFFRPPVVVRFKAENGKRAATEISRLYDDYFVESVVYSNVAEVTFRCHEDDLEKVMDRLYSLPGIKDVSSAVDSRYIR